VVSALSLVNRAFRIHRELVAQGYAAAFDNLGSLYRWDKNDLTSAVAEWPADRIGRTRDNTRFRSRTGHRFCWHPFRPAWAQYRQIACCTNRGKIAGNSGLKVRASIRWETALRTAAQPLGE
jgi:hypothetical protein